MSAHMQGNALSERRWSSSEMKFHRGRSMSAAQKYQADLLGGLPEVLAPHPSRPFSSIPSRPESRASRPESRASRPASRADSRPTSRLGTRPEQRQGEVSSVYPHPPVEVYLLLCLYQHCTPHQILLTLSGPCQARYALSPGVCSCGVPRNEAG